MAPMKQFDVDAFLKSDAGPCAKVAKGAKVSHPADEFPQLSHNSQLSPPLSGEKRNFPDAEAVADSCAHCGNRIADTDPIVIDATTDADPHPRFHARCYEPWLGARRP